MQNHFTADEWTEYVRRNFKSVGDAERWRNQNNVFVDDLPAPTYTGPLANGGSSGELPPSNPLQTPVYAPQGTPKMNDEEVYGGADATNAAAGEGDLGALSLLNMTPQDFLGKVAALQARASKVPTGMSAADYSEAEAKIKARRYGPSRTEQLFQLAAALGKPTLSRGFGEIMGNVAPALADASKANREAEAARQDALDALKRQYLLEGRTGELAKIAAEQKVLGTAAPLIAAGMKPGPRTWSEKGQRFVTEDNPMPTDITATIGGTVGANGKTTGGRRAVQYTDGNFYVANPDGSMYVYSPTLKPLRTIPAGGM